MTIGCLKLYSKVPYGVIEMDGMFKRILEKPTYSFLPGKWWIYVLIINWI
jgi:hypothetical protein